MKPASKTAAKMILARTLMPRLYAGTDGCKVKNSAARVSFDARHVFAPAKMVKKV
jgi:hypothetical protein